MGLTLWSGIINSGKFFPFKLIGCVVAITTERLFFSGIFGAVRVLSVWGLTLSYMVDKCPISVSEGGRFFSGGGFSAGFFCVE